MQLLVRGKWFCACTYFILFECSRFQNAMEQHYSVAFLLELVP